MQFTDEVNWSLADFLMAGILLFATAISLVFVSNKFKGKPFKYIFITGIIILFLLIWAEIAVGIFDF